MADTKTSALTELATTPVANDQFPIDEASSSTLKRLKWSTISGLWVPQSLVTTKGDLLIASGNGVVARQAVGANDMTPLMSDSSAANGVSWGFPSYTTNVAPPYIGLPVSTATGATNNIYYAALFVAARIPINIITGMNVMNGATANGNVRTAIYTSDGQTRLCQSNSAAQTGTSTVQQHAFSTTPTIPAGRFWVAVVFSSATATFQGAFANAGSAANGSINPPTTITIPTTGVPIGPMLSLY